jgi:hypothetical protein
MRFPRRTIDDPVLGIGAEISGKSVRQHIDVTIVAGSVQLSADGKVIRVHPIRHDRSREVGARPRS